MEGCLAERLVEKRKQLSCQTDFPNPFHLITVSHHERCERVQMCAYTHTCMNAHLGGRQTLYEGYSLGFCLGSNVFMMGDLFPPKSPWQRLPPRLPGCSVRRLPLKG